MLTAKKAAICGVLLLALTLVGPAAAQWTPGHPGDPRICSFNRPGYCGDIAARAAFNAKYQRVEGRAFVGSLQCPQTATLTYTCAWKTATLGAHQTIVRFARKASGWKVAVGVIPSATP